MSPARAKITASTSVSLVRRRAEGSSSAKGGIDAAKARRLTIHGIAA